MSGAYPLVPLGEIACPVSRPIAVMPGASYRTFGVKWWGEGAYERETIDGAETAAATLFLIREGDLVINKIWVRHGSVAIAWREVDGCAASNEFPTFELNRARVEPRWLHWLTKTRRFWEHCAALSFGTSGKNRIKPAQFLTVEVPLPSLEEQRRIVGRIEEVAGKLQSVEQLRAEVEAELAAMLRAVFNRIIAGARCIALGDVAPLVRRPVDIEPGCTYAELGVRSFGRGLFDKPLLVGSDLTWQKLFRIEEGDLVFSNIKAWEGAFAVARQRHTGMVGSHRYLTCVTDSMRASADFIWFYLQLPAGMLQIQEASPGSADRNRTLSQKGLEAVSIPLPSLDAQRWFAHLQEGPTVLVRSKLLRRGMPTNSSLRFLSALSRTMFPSGIVRAAAGGAGAGVQRGAVSGAAKA